MNAKDIICELSKLGISANQLAKLTGSSQPTISRLKRGTTKDCMYSLAKKLEQVLDSELKKRSKL